MGWLQLQEQRCCLVDQSRDCHCRRPASRNCAPRSSRQASPFLLRSIDDGDGLARTASDAREKALSWGEAAAGESLSEMLDGMLERRTPQPAMSALRA